MARLLGWQTHEAQVLADTTSRSLVRTQGQIRRQAEQAEAATLLQQPDRAPLNLQLVPHDQPRRRASWSAELTAAVAPALAQNQARRGAGVSWADRERVLTARRTEFSRPRDALRHLGPQLAPKQVLLTVDAVLTRKPEPQHVWELRTARLVMADGYRYLSGVGVSCLRVLLAVILLALRARHCLLLIADRARWIRAFFPICWPRYQTRP